MDLHPGVELPSLQVGPVSAEKMKTMAALLCDSNPIHWDVATVRALGMGDRPVNQGPNNMAYVMTMLTSWAGGYDRLRSFQVRFVSNVFAGDQLISSGVVMAVREVSDGRLVDCDVRLESAEGLVVLEGTATVWMPPS